MVAILTAAELVAKHNTMSDTEFKKVIASLPSHEKDLLVPCKVCGAVEGAECTEVKKARKRKLNRRELELKGKWRQGETVHMARRIGRMLKGIR